jgi:hypothetical protein
MKILGSGQKGTFCMGSEGQALSCASRALARSQHSASGVEVFVGLCKLLHFMQLGIDVGLLDRASGNISWRNEEKKRRLMIRPFQDTRLLLGQIDYFYLPNSFVVGLSSTNTKFPSP